MSWFWQDMLPMYSKCPAKRRLGIHLAGILPSRRPFAVRIPQIMHDERILPTLDGSSWTNPAMFDGSRWTNPVTLDGFTGRIRPCLMASPGESYRAWWFLSYKLPSRPGGSRWANPVGQSTLDEANGFHLRVRHCHFHECPLGKST